MDDYNLELLKVFLMGYGGGCLLVHILWLGFRLVQDLKQRRIRKAIRQNEARAQLRLENGR